MAELNSRKLITSILTNPGADLNIPARQRAEAREILDREIRRVEAMLKRLKEAKQQLEA